MDRDKAEFDDNPFVGDGKLALVKRSISGAMNRVRTSLRETKMIQCSLAS